MVEAVKLNKFQAKFQVPRVKREEALGRAKAEEHIALIEKFYEVHGGNPDHNLTHQFLNDLSEPSTSHWALTEYSKVTYAWRQKWVEEHPERADEDRHFFHLNTVPGPFGLPIPSRENDHRSQEQHEADRDAIRRINLEADRCTSCGGEITEEGDCA